MSKPKLSTFRILFIVLVVAALLGSQMSKQAHGQQGKIVFESNLGIYVVNPDGSGLQRLTSAEGGAGNLPGLRIGTRSLSRPGSTAAVLLTRRSMSWMRTDQTCVA